MPDHPFCEEISPNIQPEPCLVQPETVSSCSGSCCLGYMGIERERAWFQATAFPGLLWKNKLNTTNKKLHKKTHKTPKQTTKPNPTTPHKQMIKPPAKTSSLEAGNALVLRKKWNLSQHYERVADHSVTRVWTCTAASGFWSEEAKSCNLLLHSCSWCLNPREFMGNPLEFGGVWLVP